MKKDADAALRKDEIQSYWAKCPSSLKQPSVEPYSDHRGCLFAVRATLVYIQADWNLNHFQRGHTIRCTCNNSLSVCNTGSLEYFREATWRTSWRQCQRAGARNRRKVHWPGVSEIPPVSPRCIQAAGDTCRGVTRRRHERAADTIREGLAYRSGAVSLLQGTRVRSVHFWQNLQ